MPIKGLDEARQKLQELENLKSVSLGELLSPEFLSASSEFKSLEELLEKSGFKVDTPEEFLAIPDDEWETFIVSRTRFGSWEEMQKAAFQEFLARTVKG